VLVPFSGCAPPASKLALDIGGMENWAAVASEMHHVRVRQERYSD
jgi:hypothetical protein